MSSKQLILDKLKTRSEKCLDMKYGQNLTTVTNFSDREIVTLLETNKTLWMYLVYRYIKLT